MEDYLVLMLAGNRHPALALNSANNEAEITVLPINKYTAAKRRSDLRQLDLIILDIQDGPETELEICRNLRRYYTAPLLLVTQDSSERHQVRAYEAGVDECITRSIGSELLMAKVNAWLQYSGRKQKHHVRTIALSTVQSLQ